jgi:hypothetical protein
MRCSKEIRAELMNVIANTAVENNGMVYGGYVRDSIRNEHDQRTARDIVTDIDIFLQKEQASDFLLELKHNNIILEKLPCDTLLSDYLPSHTGFPYTSDFTHHKYKATLDASFWIRARDRYPIELDMSNIVDQCSSIEPVFVDIVTSETDARNPFFTIPDFECNALFIDKYGLQICSEIVKPSPGNSLLAPLEKINQIISDIFKGHARLIHTFRPRNSMCTRVQRMMDKEETQWTLVDQCIVTLRDSTYTGHCLMCHDSLGPHQMKFECCDGRYHARCMNRLIYEMDKKDDAINHRKFACPLCRHALELTGFIPDLLPSLVVC